MEALVLFQKGKNDIGGDAGEKAIGQQDAQVVQIGGSQLVLNFVIGLDDCPELRQNFAAGGRELHSIRRSDKKGGLQFILQTADAPAQSLLGDEQLL